MTEPDGPQMTI